MPGLGIYKVIDYVSSEFLSMKHLPSKDVGANALTKVLGKNKLHQHRITLGVEFMSKDKDESRIPMVSKLVLTQLSCRTQWCDYWFRGNVRPCVLVLQHPSQKPVSLV